MRRADPPFAGLGGPPAAGGTIHIVGGGPGDAGYLTLRAATILATCDVVAHDQLSPGEALELVPPHADRILVGRRAGAPGYDRESVDELLAARAAAGQAVVRLKGGDPFVFGRGGEEGAACAAAGIPFEVVPGVTSPVAVPGAAGIPITHRHVSTGFTVVTGHEASPEGERQVDDANLASFPGTLVLVMGLARLRDLAARLVEHGKDPRTPAAVVSSGTLPSQRSVQATLATIADEAEQAGLAAPAVIVIGEVVSFREHLSWREHRPLHGLRVWLPRISRRVSDLARDLRDAGAAVVESDVAEERTGDPAALARLAVDIRNGQVATTVVTDVRGSRRLLTALTQVEADVRTLARTKLWTVGEHTAQRLEEEFGLVADRSFEAASQLLADGVSPEQPAAVLAPEGDDGGLAHALDARSVVTSRIVDVPHVEVPAVDVVLLPAARLAAPVSRALAGWRLPVATMGPAGSAALETCGLEPVAEASEPTSRSMVDTLAAARADGRLVGSDEASAHSIRHATSVSV